MKNDKLSHGPFTIIFLIILDTMAIAHLATLLFREKSVDIQLWQIYGLTDFFYLLIGILIVLELVLIYLYFNKKKLGYITTFIVFGMHSLFLIAGYIFMMLNPDKVISIIEQSRIERGLHTRGVEFAANPVLLSILCALVLLFYAYICYNTYKNKDYFSE